MGGFESVASVDSVCRRIPCARVGDRIRPITTDDDDCAPLASSRHRRTTETETTMDEARFDELVRSLRLGATRRRALRLLGRGVLVGALPLALDPDPAAAISRARKRCRKKKGVFVETGECRCAYTNLSAGADRFPCLNNASCTCWEAADGTGFCGDGQRFTVGCATNAQCNNGWTCVVVRGYPGLGTACTASSQCEGESVCIRGECQATWCATPCPA